MFKVDVISEPAAALSPDGSLWGVEAQKIAHHDVSLVKPALLFAEHVELITFRVDMQTIVESEGIKNFSMPMRVLGGFAGLSWRRDPVELEMLGLSLSALCSKEEAEAFFDTLKPEGNVDFGKIQSFEIQHQEKIGNFRTAILSVLRERRSGLISSELDLAIDRGVLTCSGWSVEQPAPRDLIWGDVVNEFIPHAVQSMMERLSSSPNVPLLDPGAQLSISANSDNETLVQMRSSHEGLGLPVNIASSLVTRLPGVTELRMDELLDLRESLNDYLPAFRSELISLSEEIESETAQDATLLGREIERRWHRDIYPALQDIKQEVKKASYPRSLLDSFASDNATIVSNTASVMLAAGSVFAGAGVLIPAAATAAFPFVKALNESIKSRAEVRKNRLYFLYGIQNRKK